MCHYGRSVDGIVLASHSATVNCKMVGPGGTEKGYLKFGPSGQKSGASRHTMYVNASAISS